MLNTGVYVQSASASINTEHGESGGFSVSIRSPHDETGSVSSKSQEIGLFHSVTENRGKGSREYKRIGEERDKRRKRLFFHPSLEIVSST